MVLEFGIDWQQLRTSNDLFVGMLAYQFYMLELKIFLYRDHKLSLFSVVGQLNEYMIVILCGKLSIQNLLIYKLGLRKPPKGSWRTSLMQGVLCAEEKIEETLARVGFLLH